MNFSTSDTFPTFRKMAVKLRRSPGRCLRRLRSILLCLRTLFFSRTSLKCYLILATLIVGTYTTFRWIGRRAWEAEKQRVVALGMELDVRNLASPTPTDGQNFLAAEVFQDLMANPPRNLEKYTMWLSKTKWADPNRKGVNRSTHVPRPKRATLPEWGDYFRQTGMFSTPSTFPSTAKEIMADERWVPTIEAIYAASLRPSSKFPTISDTGVLSNRIMTDLHRSVIFYAQAHLEEGDPAKAFPALSVTNHLVQAFAAEPSFLPQYRIPGLLITEYPFLQSGMRLHRWTAPVLRTLLAADYPALIQKINRRMISYERLGSCGLFENFPESYYGSYWAGEHPYHNFLFKHLVPDYHLRKAAIRTSNYHSRLYEAAAPLGINEPWSERIQSLAGVPDRNFSPRLWFGNNITGFTSMREFSFIHVAPIVRASIRQLAIAVELHYLIHAKYPLSLDQIDPSIPISQNLLKDFSGQSIQYETDPTGAWFTLISSGMDGVENSPHPHPDDIIFSTDPARNATR